MGESQDWIDRLAIEGLIYGYADGVTRADWDQIEAVFAPDAIWESPAVDLRFEGARTFRDFLAQTGGSELLIQTVHQPVVRLLGSEQAQATTTVHEVVRGNVVADSAYGEAGTAINFEQYGIYHDDAAKIDGTWKFTHRLFVPIYLTPDCVTGQVVAPRSSLLRPV